MATEKIAKAYRMRDTKADPDDLARHHAGFEEFVTSFFRSATIREEYRRERDPTRGLCAPT